MVPTHRYKQNTPYFAGVVIFSDCFPLKGSTFKNQVQVVNQQASLLLEVAVLQCWVEENLSHWIAGQEQRLGTQETSAKSDREPGKDLEFRLVGTVAM